MESGKQTTGKREAYRFRFFLAARVTPRLRLPGKSLTLLASWLSVLRLEAAARRLATVVGDTNGSATGMYVPGVERQLAKSNTFK